MSARDVAAALLDISAVKLSPADPFTWTSGIKSPIYCDNRMMISHVAERDLVVDGFVSLINEKNLECDVIAGTATAAIAWAAFVAQKMNKPMVYIRPKKKEHGAGKQIEGDLPAGSKVLLIEDLISTGGSSLRAVEAIEDEGQSTCEDVLAIVTYGTQKSVSAFQSAGKNLSTLTSFIDILDESVSRESISEDQKKAIQDFLNDPSGWGERNGF